jgi:hypothetical protein
MRIKVILHIIFMIVVLVSCDDYDFDEENYVPLHLETTLKDKSHTTIGYAYTGGVVKDKHYDMIGNVFTDGKVLDKNYDRAGTIIKQTETTYKVEDSHYNTVGYVNITTGEVKDKHYTVVGYGSGENIWKAGVILLLFDM